MKKALISFVGTNDNVTFTKGKGGGAILTVLSERKFDSLHLIYHPTKINDTTFYEIAIKVKNEAIKDHFIKNGNIFLHFFDCDNVTDHNEIYPKLLSICNKLPGRYEYTAAIASGTPSMQECWILIAESGDFKVKLVRSNEQKYGIPLVTEVKLGTSLPQIIKLKKENIKIQKELKKKLAPIYIDEKNFKIIIEPVNNFVFLSGCI